MTSLCWKLVKNEGRARHFAPSDQHHTATGHQLLDALRLGAGVIVTISFHQVDHAPHSQTGTEGNNERLKDRNRLIDKFHRVTSLIFECE